jgi:phosphatidylglycerol:prolipoprotein diacylglycerol transferase
MPARLVSDFVTYCAIGILAGGRLGYVLFYSRDLIFKFKSEAPYWGVLAVNEGGMASHGGVIGALIAAGFFARKYKINSLHLFDLLAITGPIGIFFGRIANFINGELVGRPAPADFALGVKFPSDILLWPSQEPGKLHSLAETVEPLGISKEQWFDWVGKFRLDPASRDRIQETLYNIVDAIQNGQVAVKEAIAPHLIMRHPSQLYAAAGEGLLLFLILAAIWYRPRKPGIIGAWFVVIYSVIRISDEYFRMPDAHIGYELFDLTRGQWLSIAMFFIGIVLVLIWGRRSTLPISGWGKSTY